MKDALFLALEKRYQPPEYALFFEVANGVGAHRRRYADALAMSLFPSRGLDIHGIEIKEDRADWLREKKNPHKADEIAAYCDYWWLVVSNKDVAQVDELPGPWGLLVLHGKELRAVKKAEKLQPKPLDRPFVACILRRAYESIQDKLSNAKHLKDAEERGRARGAEDAKSDIEIAQRELNHYKRRMEDFETKSGLKLNDWNAGDVGEAVRTLMNLPQRDHSREFNQAAEQFERTAVQLRERAKAMKEFQDRAAATGKEPING